ncbi:hypothetical protein ACFLYU_03750 [Candidatus Dependentiae bacterium]
MTSRRFSAYFLAVMILWSREASGMRYVKKAWPLIKYGMPALPFITTFAYHLVSYFFVIGRIDNNVRVVRRDVRELKEDARILKDGVKDLKEDTQSLKSDTGEIKEDTKVLKEGTDVLKKGVDTLQKDTQDLKDSVQNFKDETDEHFLQVRSDVSVMKTKILQEIARRQKIVSDAIRSTEKNLKKDIREKHISVTNTLEAIEQVLRGLSTKEDLKLLRSFVTDLDAKINSLREDILASVKESESRQKLFFKDHINKLENNNNNKFSLLKKYIKKLETNSYDIKDLISKNNQNIGVLDEKITKISNEVSEIKKILINT